VHFGVGLGEIVVGGDGDDFILSADCCGSSIWVAGDTELGLKVEGLALLETAGSSEG
jgi:hypothetical protein